MFSLQNIFGGPSGLVLLYHRIAEPKSDPQLLAVTPSHFAEHLEVLRRQACPVSLHLMVDALRDRRLPPGAVALTFDDGYADNLSAARPLLERYDAPATVFVAAGYVGQDREFWWDDLERLLLLPGRLPSTLHLRIGEAVHEWRLADAADYSEDACRSHAGWNIEMADDPTPRHRAYRDLCRLLRGVTSEIRVEALAALSALAGTTSAGRATHRALSGDELVRLTEGGVADVGAHAVTHSVLSALPIAAQRSEIAQSRACLQKITGQDVTSFAYPFGSRADYAPSTVALVREAGFDRACSNRAGRVRRGTDPFQLPRALVRDWDGDTFARRLREWLGA